MNKERVRVGERSPQSETSTKTARVAPAIVAEIDHVRSGGSPISDSIRAPMERKFGHDFGDVRIHSDDRSQRLSNRLNAAAFTVGKDVFLGAKPTRETIGHELLHTTQAHSTSLSGLTAAPDSGSHETRVRSGLSGGPSLIAPTLFRRSKGGELPPADTIVHPKEEVERDPQKAKAAVDLMTPREQATLAEKTGDSALKPDNGARPINSAAHAKSDAPDPKMPTQQTAAVEPESKAKDERSDPLKDPDNPQTAEAGEAPPPALTPETDPNFQAVAKRTKAVAAGQHHHPGAGGLAGSAQRATTPPGNEVAGQASANQVEAMSKTKDPPPFEAQAFIDALNRKIDRDVPSGDQDKVESFAKDKDKPNQFNEDLKSDAQSRRSKTDKEIRGAAKSSPDESKVKEKTPEKMETPEVGGRPAIANAAQATPSPRPAKAFNVDEGPKKVDGTLQAANVKTSTLRKSNEPAFNQAADSADEVRQHAAEAPGQAQAQEATVLTAAKANASGNAGVATAQMFGSRTEKFDGAKGKQEETKTRDQKEREEIAGKFQKIFNDTQQSVRTQLDQVEKDVNDKFDSEAEQKRKDFADSLDQAIDDYKSHRHSGIWGKALAIKDYVAGLPDEVQTVYDSERQKYVDAMQRVIKDVANMVANGLNKALDMIKDGRSKIRKEADGLTGERKKIADEEAAKIEEQFTQLTGEVSDKRDALLQSLAAKYTDSLKQVDDIIEKTKAENAGLVDKAIGFIKGVINTIIELKNMLLRTLQRVADAISLIIEDPIGFLGNLVQGVKRGLGRFIANIGKHLLNGLVGWLFGAIAEAGIQLPATFDLKGILSLILQVLGLTYANIRSRAVKLVGEKVVGALESAAEIFKVLISEGPAGLIKFIKDKIETLKDAMMDEIKSFVLERIIMAGIQWVIGLLNPAGAFIKACKAIYDIIMFFIERGSQIMALVNAIIDSVMSIAQGNIEVAAAFVENAMAKTVPVIISFLAALLGVGGISEKIKSVIHKIQSPINKAIDWTLGLAVKAFKAAGNFIGGLFGKKKKDEPAKQQKQLDDPSGAKGLALARLHQESAHMQHPSEAGPVLGRILNDLRPHGLKSLELGPMKPDGEYPILAAASDKEPLGILIPRGRSVRMDVKIELAPVENAAFLPTSNDPARDDQIKRQEVMQGTNRDFRKFSRVNGQLQEVIPRRVPLPIAQTSNTSPRARRGGFIDLSNARASQMDVKTWNTGDIDPRKTDNASHAEPQFTQWFASQPDEFVRRVISIHVERITWSPCIRCAGDMEGVVSRLSRAGNPLDSSRLIYHWNNAYPNIENRAQPGQPAGWTIVPGTVTTPTAEDTELVDA